MNQIPIKHYLTILVALKLEITNNFTKRHDAFYRNILKEQICTLRYCKKNLLYTINSNNNLQENK